MPDRPTNVRYLVLSVTAAAAVFMYVDRVCIAQVSPDITAEFKAELLRADPTLDDAEASARAAARMDWVKSAFFWSYALAQVPAGALGMRFGYRQVLAAYLFLWSFFTAVSGLAGGFAALVGARLAVGVTEAGAYPTAAALVKGWFPLPSRGVANSVVALGGRLGGALGQLLTPGLVVALSGVVLVAGEPAAGWRVTLVLYGLLGILWAGVFWWVVRDRPAAHPRANPAEVAHAGPAPSAAPSARPPVLLFLASRNLWAFSLVQFFNNLGWAFLITHFPDYLEQVHGVRGAEKGFVSSLPGFVGCAGMFLGGFLTDRLVRRLGVRRGRLVPILCGTAGAAAAYLFCATADSMWAVVAAMCALTVATDLAIPAVWAVAQDIGGKRVGPVLGWANMWGNFGAACCPLVLGLVQRQYGWPAVFWTGAAAYAASTCLALAVNASKPVDADDA
ncbi:MAG: hypothetical protein C0501_06595 [Isosphaera sp.]|nr:hypothetical protein [Isosphaera sp.]